MRSAFGATFQFEEIRSAYGAKRVTEKGWARGFNNANMISCKDACVEII